MGFQEDIDKVFKMYQQRKDIVLDEIPESLKKDLRHFTYGATLYKNKSGQKVLPFVDFASWHNKIVIKGIDILPTLHEKEAV